MAPQLLIQCNRLAGGWAQQRLNEHGAGWLDTALVVALLRRVHDLGRLRRCTGCPIWRR
jgi:hypothetical protein